MKKRIIALILSVVVCIGLCACGVQTGTKIEDTNSKEDKNTETTSDTSDVTTGTSETESETTDEPVDATVS